MPTEPLPPQPAGTGAAQYWDQLYAATGQIWSGRVNEPLASRAASLAPGTALDLGCGEGADAIWLARRGWRVTGVDVSAVAIRRAREHAEAAGVAQSITFACQDAAAALPPGPFDLVSAQYFQTPLALDSGAVLRVAAAAVAPGGTLLIVAHAAPPSYAPQDQGAGHGHEHHHQDFPSPSSLLAQLRLGEEWVIEEAQVIERDAAAPDGGPAHLLDCVVRARRG